MTDEQKWLLIFGRGWVDRVVIEDADYEMYEMYKNLAIKEAFVYDLSLYRVKLKEKEVNEIIRV
jgi:hypothetical protein